MNPIKTGIAAHERRESWAPLLGLSAQEVFSMMLGGELSIAPEPFSGEGLDVTSMVGLAGSVCGLLTLRCTAKSAALIAAKMLGTDGAIADPESWDAVGEVCNMVAGNFKTKIAGIGDSCELSVPTVIVGANYSLHALADDCTIEVSLMFEGLPVILSLKINS
jgi:chemotaxis protein CheX